MYRILLYSLLFLTGQQLFSQNYQALNGSSYSGSLTVHNNPAAIVNSPYRWDLTLLGAQAKAATNAVQILKYSLLSKAGNGEYLFKGGSFERKAVLNSNINLLNARIALNRKSAIAFGANIRAYARLVTGEYNFYDTLHTLTEFLSLNERTQPLGGDFISSGWIEIYGSYGRTIFDNADGRLNAAITLKLSRGVSGAYAGIQNGRFNRTGTGNNYTFGSAAASYGYSSNYDRWQNSRNTAGNLRDFLRYTDGGISLDAGIEYLVKPGYLSSSLEEEETFNDYDWKIGVSLLDLGVNQYRFGINSRNATGIRSGISSLELNNKMDSTIRSLSVFNDSLATVVQQISQPGGQFRVLNPARLVVNVDRFLTGAFYVNAELSLNLSGVFGKKYFYVKEMNLLTVSPRWETGNWGAYLPLSFTTENNFWVGAAVKAGPLLIGLHNLGFLFSKKSLPNGGGYIALVIHSFNASGNRGDKRLNCPPNLW